MTLAEKLIQETEKQNLSKLQEHSLLLNQLANELKAVLALIKPSAKDRSLLYRIRSAEAILAKLENPNE